jgi:hypothetical protein
MAGENTQTIPDTPAREEQRVPQWVVVLAGIALLSMASQIKLPVAGGRLALADVTLAAAFAGVLLTLWRTGRSLRYPAALGLGLALYGVAALFARSGLGGALETAQRVEQFFCGFLLFAFLLENRPKLIPRLLTAGLAINLVVACVQGTMHGFGATLPPADVLDLTWGFGGAFTGLFRSPAALSFFLAAALALVQPFWLRWAESTGRAFCVLLATLVVLSFISYGPLLAVACIVLVLAGLLQSRKAARINIAAVVLLALTLPIGGDGVRAHTVLQTLTPASTRVDEEGVLKTRHLDTIAAMRMARKRPLTGVGAGRYQEFIGRCFGELPNPNFNDIDTDTQAGLGILLGTSGFVAGLFLVLLFAWGMSRGLRTALSSERAAPFLLGGSFALAVFLAGLLVSDPFVNGLSWFLCLALTWVTLPTPGHASRTGIALGWKGIVLTGVLYGILAGLVLIVPKNRDPLAGSAPHATQIQRPARTTQTATASVADTAAQTETMSGTALDLFRVIDAGDAKTITPPIVKTTDSQAGKQTILHIPDESGKPPEGEQPDMKYGGALYTLDLPADVSCKIWLRVWWEGSCGNTVYVKVGADGKPITVGNDGTFDAWHWLEVPKVYSLEKGSHDLYILNREDGIRIDQILVTNDMEYFPQGIEEE